MSVADKVKVHFVPHSHLDAGWLKTYDEYWEERVESIFKSVFNFMMQHPSVTYTIGDLAFFRRFYEESYDTMRGRI